jgi:hypothetical protein
VSQGGYCYGYSGFSYLDSSMRKLSMHIGFVRSIAG